MKKSLLALLAVSAADFSSVRSLASYSLFCSISFISSIRLFILRQGSERPIPERVIVQVLSAKIAVTKVSYMLETLITAGYLTETEAPKGRLTQWGVKGFRFFKPGPDINKII